MLLADLCLARGMSGQAPAFSMLLRLSDITLDCGEITRELYRDAPGGNFGKVFFGWYRGMRVAVKFLASKPDVAATEADVAFKREGANMVAIRSAVERARVRASLGAPLTEPCDLRDETRRCSEPHGLRGHRHVVVVYGIGTEPELSTIAHGLPPGPAHLIVMEELSGGTLEVPPAEVDALLKVAAELASSLAFLSAAHVVHADLKVS